MWKHDAHPSRFWLSRKRLPSPQHTSRSAIAAVGAFNLSFVFPGIWTPAQRTVGSGFLIGAFVQVTLVLLGAYLLGLVDVRRAISGTFSPSTDKAWTIPVIATAIHIGTGLRASLPQPERVGCDSSLIHHGDTDVSTEFFRAQQWRSEYG
ncbi:MAG: hypothetical protein H0W20_15240 [Chthoniobacterales bacterium]|nr:hypothetical protein [Chthoniobacterales bacterium]